MTPADLGSGGKVTPADLGLPSKFASYRSAQIEAVEQAAYWEKSVRALALPTGSGKTLTAWSIAKLLGGRAVYLMATRALQDQNVTDFESAGVKDLRGKANYYCTEHGLKWKQTCEQGADGGCDYFEKKSGSCSYRAAQYRWLSSDMGTSNYSYWLHMREYDKDALGQVDVLICDEAGQIENELGRFLQVTVLRDQYEGSWAEVTVGEHGDMGEDTHWNDWAKDEAVRLTEQRSRLTAMLWSHGQSVSDSAEYEDLSERIGKAKKISAMTDDWVWEATDKSIVFDCIHPGKYSGLIWGGIPTVILMSATLRPYTMRLLGFDRGTYDYREWASAFPPQNAPVYHIPVVVNGRTVGLSYKSTDDDYRAVIAVADAILDARPDRKGIIHTVSYSRAQTALSMSRNRSRLIFNHDGKGARDAVDRFRAADPRSGAVLVSPSFATGWDFPGDQAEYQIILKVPFPNTQSYVMERRCDDAQYRLYFAMQELVQMCGRIVRTPTDVGETFILDGKVGYLLGAAKIHRPDWFKVWTVDRVPAAPKISLK